MTCEQLSGDGRHELAVIDVMAKKASSKTLGLLKEKFQVTVTRKYIMLDSVILAFRPAMFSSYLDMNNEVLNAMSNEDSVKLYQALEPAASWLAKEVRKPRTQDSVKRLHSFLK